MDITPLEPAFTTDPATACTGAPCGHCDSCFRHVQIRSAEWALRTQKEGDPGAALLSVLEHLGLGQ